MGEGRLGVGERRSSLVLRLKGALARVEWGPRVHFLQSQGVKVKLRDEGETSLNDRPKGRCVVKDKFTTRVKRAKQWVQAIRRRYYEDTRMSITFKSNLDLDLIRLLRRLSDSG